MCRKVSHRVIPRNVIFFFTAPNPFEILDKILWDFEFKIQNFILTNPVDERFYKTTALENSIFCKKGEKSKMKILHRTEALRSMKTKSLSEIFLDQISHFFFF